MLKFLFKGIIRDRLLPMIVVTIWALLSSNALLFGQQISGTVFEIDGKTPVEFVNIGVVGKNVGTVSDRNGNYTLQIPSEFHDDTLKFSSIGYYPYSVKVSDFINLNNGNVCLELRAYDLSEVVVRPRSGRQRILGNTSRFRVRSRNWSNTCPRINSNGYEFGRIIRNENSVLINELYINIESMASDSLSLRINIYKVLNENEKQFENILNRPILINISKQEIRNRITIDIRHHYLVVEGDFLVTLESYHNVNSGYFCVSADRRELTPQYSRNTSQGIWQTSTDIVGAEFGYRGSGLSVAALVEER